MSNLDTLSRNTPRRVRSIQCKLKMIAESEKAARNVNETSGNSKSYITFRSRKVSFYFLQWPNWAWNTVFGYAYHILRMCYYAVHFDPVNTIHVIDTYKIQSSGPCQGSIPVSQKLEKYCTTLLTCKHRIVKGCFTFKKE